MATALETMLKLQDRFSKPLAAITRSAQAAEKAMSNLQRVVGNVSSNKLSNSLSSANSQVSKMANNYSTVSSKISSANNEQQNLNRSISQGNRESSEFLSNLKGIAAAYLGIQTASQLGQSTVGAAMSQQQTIDTFAARSGSEALGQAIFNEISKQAIKFGQDVDQALSGTMSFMSNTLDPKQLAQMNKLSMRLAKLNPAEGLEGAAFSMKELLSGDYISMVERFNIGKSQIQGSDALAAGKAGDVDAFINGMDKLLDQQNMTEEAFEKMLDSPASKWTAAINNLKFKLASVGQEAMTILAPVFDQINNALDSEQATTFFYNMSRGIANAVQIGVELINTMVQIYNFFYTNWPTISPIIYGVVAALASFKLAAWGVATAMALAAFFTGTGTAAIFLQTWAVAGLSAAWATLNAVMKRNVIIFVISAVIGLVTWLVTLWKTNDEFAAGFLKVWYNILNFFDQVPIFFVGVGRGIAQAFLDAKTQVLIYMEDMVNGVIDRLNDLISTLNNTGVISLDFIGGVQFSAESQLQAAAFAASTNSIMNDMKSNAAAKAAERELKLEDFKTARAAKRAENAAAKAETFAIPDTPYTVPEMSKMGGAPTDMKIPKVGKVDEVGKINDTVDVASEDLKLMREIAQRKNIQNFVQLNPTVSVTTGDLKGETDINVMIKRITNALTDEVASTAKGVYELA